jgi:hypothetical protein
MAQTAVDWLFTTLDNILELYPSEWSKVSKAVEEAKAIEKSSIMAAYMRGSSDITKLINLELVTIAEQYYNETYENGL